MKKCLAWLPIFFWIHTANAQQVETNLDSAIIHPLSASGIRKIKITPATKEINQAIYYATVRQRVNIIASEHPPLKAGKRLYGNVLLWLPLNKDGSLFEGDGGPKIEQSSGDPDLDQAAIRMLREAAPFAAVPYLNASNTEKLVNELLVWLEFPDAEELQQRRAETLKNIAAKAPTVNMLHGEILPSPNFPESARRNGEEGKVVVRALISEAGIVKAVKVERSSGHASLDLAASEVTWNARFEPYLENWKPTPVWVLIPYSFVLSANAGNDNPARTGPPVGVKMAMKDSRSIAEKIKSNTFYEMPTDVGENNPVEYNVSLVANGSVREIEMVKSSGLPEFDKAVRLAIEKSQPYVDVYGKIPPGFILSHRPKETLNGR